MKKGIILIWCAIGISIILTTGCHKNENDKSKWTKSIGGPGRHYGYSVKQTADSGYIIAGKRDLNGILDSKLYLVKTDEYGDTLWTKSYIGDTAAEGQSVDVTSDGGYIVTGSTYNSTDRKIYLVKTNGNGDTVWTKTFSGPYNNIGYSVKQTSDGGYVITGLTDGGICLIKTDANGNQTWAKTYGLSSGRSVLQLSDGGYVIAGLKYGATGICDIILIRTDINGNQLWTRTFGGNSWNEAHSVDLASDGGYIIAGYTNSVSGSNYEFYLIKTDANGEEVWSKTFGKGDGCDARSVQTTSDGGYIIVSITYSGENNDDVYLVKTDANGNKTWAKTYGDGKATGYSVDQTSDGGYIITGWISVGDHEDLYLIKTDEDGNTE
jgi:hypothetical protein